MGGWVFLACPFDDEWPRLCSALGRPDLLEDPRFITPDARNDNDDALASELATIFADRLALEWESLLTAADVGCVQTEDRGMYHFFAEDEHVAETGLTVDVSHLKYGEFWRYAPILEFSKTPCVAGGGITRGQHTFPILRELGFTDDQILKMREKASPRLGRD